LRTGKQIGFLLVVIFCVGSARAQEVKVELTHASPAPVSTNDTAIFVSLLSGGDLYLDSQRVTKDQLGEKIREVSKQIPKTSRIVYFAATPDIEYRNVVDVLQIIRVQDVGQIALMIDRVAGTPRLPRVFVIEVPLGHQPDEDVSTLKPNPLTLLVTMSTELELRLNRDDMGTDLAYLQKSLLRLFERRTEVRAFKVGMETRTDIPLEERIEKIVFVKAPLSVRYGDVLRVIDAVKGAGANPIGLQVDDLVR
jgi:biopolymer transport protein ExbD